MVQPFQRRELRPARQQAQRGAGHIRGLVEWNDRFQSTQPGRWNRKLCPGRPSLVATGASDFLLKVKEARSFGESRDLQDVSRSFCYGVGGDVPLNGRPMRRTRSWKRGSARRDRKSTRLNSSHGYISYAVFCLKKKKKEQHTHTSSCIDGTHE